MDNYAADEEIELPPGFRFHPTDEELITHYLSPKVLQSGFCAKAIGEVDLNKVEPWDLPWRAKMGEREFYFFCVKDKKYPTGSRTNRATDAGYWKATGKDKEIYSGKNLIGMKKTLVFYKGRAPKGEKTNWVMHEYRLEGTHTHDLAATPRNEWVISRIFRKTSGGQKIHISNLKGMGDYDDQTRIAAVETSHLSSFLNPTEENEPEKEAVDGFINPLKFPESSFPGATISTRLISDFENFHYQDCGTGQDQSILRYLVREDGCLKSELSQESENSTGISWNSPGHETGPELLDPYYSAGPVDLACLWNY